MGRKKSRKAVESLDIQLELLLFPDDKPGMVLIKMSEYEVDTTTVLDSMISAGLEVQSKGEELPLELELGPKPVESITIAEKKGRPKPKRTPGKVLRKVEFKIKLTPEQLKTLKEYLRISVLAWNRGLALIEWREWHEKWAKVKEACPNALELGVLPVDMRWHLNEASIIQEVKPATSKKSKKKKTEEEKAAEKQRKKEQRKGLWGLCCDRVIEVPCDRELLPGEWIITVPDKHNKEKQKIVTPRMPRIVTEGAYGKPHWLEKPLLDIREEQAPTPRKPTPSNQNQAEALSYAFAQKHWPKDDYLWECETKWIAGVTRRLGKAWKEHKEHEKGRPRYKRPGKISSIINVNTKEIKIANGELNLPGIGKVRPKGLEERWGDRPASAISVILKGDTVYLQLTGEFDPKPAPKLTGRSIGIDPGVVRLYTDDEGHHVLPSKYLKKAQQKIKRLEDKIDRQVKANTVEGVDKKGYHRRVDKEGWEKKNLQKTRDKLAKEHDKIRRQRRAFNHFHSTKLVRFADEIAIEDTNLRNITKAVSKGESGKPNGRKRKKGLNKSVLDNAIGQFREMIKTKAEGAGRTFRLVPAHKTSQRCSQCGHESPDNRKTQSHFECVACGYTDNADKNAAKNMKQYREEI